MAQNEYPISRRRFVKGTLGAACLTALESSTVLSTKEAPAATQSSYDLDRLSRIEPALIQYNQCAKPIYTGFSVSRGIALDSKGSLYVAGDRGCFISRGNNCGNRDDCWNFQQSGLPVH